MISFGFNVRNNNLKRIEISDLIKTIRSSIELRKLTSALRNLQTDEERRRFKIANLPYFNMGIFNNNVRSDFNLMSTKFFVVDCDYMEKNKLIKVMDLLAGDDYVYFAFISPSGNGLKIVFELDDEITDIKIFNQAYKAFCYGFAQTYGVLPDEKTCDPSRACFLAYDPNVIVHKNHNQVSLSECLKYGDEILEKAKSKIAAEASPVNATSVSARQYDPSIVGEVIDYLVKLNIERQNIYNTYSSWQKMGLCLASMGEVGRNHFIKLTTNNPNYTDTEKDADEEFSKLMKYYDVNHPNPAGVHTLIGIAKKYGYKVDNKTREESFVYDKSDMDLANIFISRHQNDIRALHNFFAGDRLSTFSKWLIYDGKRWAVDNKGNIFEFVRKTVKKLLSEAAKCSDRKLAGKIEDCAAILKNMSKQKSMLYQAATNALISVESKEMDRDIFLFNCLNCTLSLSDGNITLQKHDRNNNISKLALVSYDPDAHCTRWDDFIKRVCMGKTDLIAFIKRAVGLSLTGDVSEQSFFFVFGPGGNGKSVFFKVLMTLFNDYAQKAPSAMLAQQRYMSVPNDVARLQGTRFVVASELDDSMVFDEAKIKDLTGGDAIVARFFRQEYFEFEPRFKLWLYGNHKPVIKGNDVGIWRRIHLIPFTATFSEKEKISFGKLVSELLKESSGILNWALDGYKDYVQNGLAVPSTVSQATITYKNEQDVIGRFLKEKCVIGVTANCAAKDMYKNYSKWCQENGEQPLSQRKFNSKLRDMGFVTKAGTNNKTEWIGIGLINDEVTVPVFEGILS